MLLIFTGYASAVDKFDWKATECAPENYPMQIVKGDFLYPDGGSLYVPDGKTIHDGWGVDISSHVVGPDLKPLPNRLDIIFFSYTENQFYSGKFDLPYEKILKFFNDGYFSPKENKHITYERIMAGITPGGAVAVWLIGNDKTTEVFFGQADKTDGDWHWINDNPNIPREEYIRRRIKSALKTPEAIATLQKNGIPFGRWETYHRKRYQWQPLFAGMAAENGLIDRVKYFNGEEDYLYYPLDDAVAKETRAIPKEIYFTWDRPNEYNLVYKLFFDEEEIFELFEKLGKGNKPLTLEMKMIDTEKGKQFGVLLRNDEEGIYFRKLKVKKYRA